MKNKGGISLTLFLGATLLSAWLSPALRFERGMTAAGRPESFLPGGMNGRTLLRSGEELDVRVGAGQSVNDIEWRLNGRLIGTAPELRLPHVRNGEHTLSLTYRDAQGRLYGVTSVIRILEPETYAIQAAAIQAAITLPLWDEDKELFLPLIKR